MKSVFSDLEKYVGFYRGDGINHEQQPFTGELSLSKSIGGFNLTFRATGKDQTLYHEENTTIALSPNEKIALWSVNTNNPFMLQHDLRKDETQKDKVILVFGFNDPGNTQAFREEIKMELHADGQFGYHYSWGMPGGEFKPRSGVTMQKEDAR